jgi:hypothetical protein
LGDGVPDRAQLEGYQVVELIAAVRGGGESEPAAGRDLLDGVLERGGGDVVALVDDDQPVAAGELLDVGLAGQGLQGARSRLGGHTRQSITSRTTCRNPSQSQAPHPRPATSCVIPD